MGAGSLVSKPYIFHQYDDKSCQQCIDRRRDIEWINCDYVIAIPNTTHESLGQEYYYKNCLSCNNNHTFHVLTINKTIPKCTQFYSGGCTSSHTQRPVERNRKNTK